MFFQPTYSVSCCIATARSRVFEEHFLGGRRDFSPAVPPLRLDIRFGSLTGTWTRPLRVVSQGASFGGSENGSPGEHFEAAVPPGYHAGSRRPKQPQSCVNPQKKGLATASTASMALWDALNLPSFRPRALREPGASEVPKILGFMV